MKETYVCFGRFNPPTKGHEEIWKWMESKGEAIVVLSTNQSLGLRGENPLPVYVRASYIREVLGDSEVRIYVPERTTRGLYDSINEVARLRRIDHLILVCGPDREDDFRKFCYRVEHNPDNAFQKISFVVCDFGNRDSVSGTIQRQLVLDDNYSEFERNCPDGLSESSKRRLFDDLRFSLHGVTNV